MQEIKVLKRDGFPPLLQEIHDPPEELFVWGEIPDMPMLAVVGTRKVSPYGKQVTPRLVQDLARAGLCIVSGLAYGIDALAHQAALDAGAKTVAVLGSGLDRASLYPREHWRLAERIVKNGGAVVSEYPEGAEPKPYHFPARNRIVAGMSRGVLVIEAPEKSGALITADLALRENRDVFCVPGSIASQNSVGPNRLIQLGAKLVMRAEDVLEEWEMETAISNQASGISLSEEQQKIIEALKDAPRHVDAIVKETKLDITTCNVGLVELELQGLIKNLGGGMYARV
ncbi:MAG: DNA protecting protein DprA [Candidatus Terrybacteria bacterium RIFCSPHIGHO2_01_FULL_48_17]|uniref:DNA protecting protein DprA n=1 Tax=Candidatus Terrybacteria bacterium RIFCSPHIGHO2_01_FULL_48_17 TaxID=1802362 RepID=A0A1G2PHF1_9BACT|nr:MAG: DNA protecting protein DprA [Candidatus Terrybacteria bacterium RIFCSPHIGHO2_01_FULL_48_17]OHA52248.1 MAG: DNA protecting protein DprA [Candidatus Terrybacteria bacterium RIFCSPLOWO2_01_FULL_48_14]